MMNRIILVKVLLILVLYAAVALTQDDFAPLGPFTEIPSTLKNARIPSKEEVGILSYPDAFLVTVMEMNLGGEGDTLIQVGMNLISIDPMEKIIEFYKNELPDMPGWHWEENFNYFYKGESAFDFNAARISFIEASPDDFDLLAIKSDVRSQVKTRIQIGYPLK
jgi:hypothetical protein